MSVEEPSDEQWIEHMIETSATEEQYLEFLAGLRDLVRCQHLAAEDIVSAVGQAVDKAVGGNIADATEWVERVVLGMIGPVEGGPDGET